MKEKFIRIISPITFCVVLLLDISVIVFGVTAVQKIMQGANFYTVSFLIIEIISIVICFFVSREVVSNGVKFGESEFEFTAIDENGIFKYDEIKSVKGEKDNSVSFRKNFIDRFSHIYIETKDGNTTTIDLGLTTTKKLNKIVSEIKSRTSGTTK